MVIIKISNHLMHFIDAESKVIWVMLNLLRRDIQRNLA